MNSLTDRRCSHDLVDAEIRHWLYKQNQDYRDWFNALDNAERIQEFRSSQRLDVTDSDEEPAYCEGCDSSPCYVFQGGVCMADECEDEEML